ncbi:PTS transporter subunit EIIC [Paenibacillus sp. GSMTC-2017]|uniref:PTS transporter subunit EIIC n=1 Tax=Paenibacillus sp. GSMTC-2017 TaxID=2794350 RepID=UPI0018DA18B2|nr:PTS transporter subunit EIIC [Paenibacillus sp. GSMTC-2017]MBH5318916.1 PTS transporter subunit EIIC [Paenibacillus sp. GSMTC-2017]
MSYIQRIGRSLMIPIAVMPAAAILFRFGKIEFDHPFLIKLAAICEAAGGAIFDHLPLLFAIGIAIGLTQGQGVAALSAAIGYMVFQEVMRTFEVVQTNDLADTNVQMGVLGGLITGGITAYLYNRFKDFQLPQALGFFSGRRFVPIITSLTMTVLGGTLGFIWMPIQDTIQVFGLWLESTGGIGTFLYGTINRLLIPTGLHHIINHILWFQIGEYAEPGGNFVQGDLTRFYAGDPTAGTYMTGFFPVMMFGLPGAAFAMIKCARPENRKVIMSIMLSSAFTSFLTGVTEQIEFAFMLLAPFLFVVHALLTGLSMTIMYMLEVKMGFGFSAGFIDLAINWNDASNPWLIFPVGLAYFVIYYFTFYFSIRYFNLATPGRIPDIPDRAAQVSTSMNSRTMPISRNTSPKLMIQKAVDVLEFIGGTENIVEVDACITRLRLTLNDAGIVHEHGLKELGAAGIIRIGKDSVHVVFGTDSELIKEEIQRLISQNAIEARGLGDGRN